jgi:futalosine hydrolase
MNVVIVTATEREIVQIKQVLNGIYKTRSLEVSFHESGVGLLNSCFSITNLIFEKKPGLIIQAGIAGAFNLDIPLGAVVAVRDEIMADTGVVENGKFKDLFDLNLQEENSFPFTQRKLQNNNLNHLNYLQLPEVTGVTVNEITTQVERIEVLRSKYDATIESMEGASLHYCCLHTSTPFIQIRAVSNYVGERDKAKWNFKDAFSNLATCINSYIDLLDQNYIVR